MAVERKKRAGDDSSPGAGHNSGNVAADRLRSLIERIERLTEERQALGADIKDIYTEAQSAGFDAAVIRTLVKLRSQNPTEVAAREHLLATYRHALGMPE